MLLIFCGRALRRLCAPVTAAVLVIGFGLSGCGLTGDDAVFQMQFVDLRSEADANGDSPTAVDFVLVYDAKAIQSLTGVTAADWFARRRQFQLDFPDGLLVKSWEVVPNSIIPVWEIPEELMRNRADDRAVTAYIFADYLSPGDHRARLEMQTGISINLQRDDFTLAPYFPNGNTGG